MEDNDSNDQTFVDEDAGYDANFVDEVADYFKCLICHLVVKDPVLLVECGHRYCNICFNRMKENADERNAELLCPTDRTPVDSDKVYDDKSTSRAVLDLQVRCDHYLQGCQWTGELRNLPLHLDGICSVKEKQRTTSLIQEIADRLERCERSLEEKDDEITSLREILQIQKGHEYCEKRLDEKDEEISALKDCLKHSEDVLSRWISSLESQLKYMKQSSGGKKRKWSATDLCENSDSEDVGPISSFLKYHEEAGSSSVVENEFPISDEQDVPSSSSSSSSSLSGQLSASNKKLFNKINEEITLLQQHVTNTKQLMSNHTTYVYTWKLQNYAYHKENSDSIFSPRFYTSVDGHCCKLNVRWFGEDKEILLFYFYFCCGGNGEVKNEPLKMRVELFIYHNGGHIEVGEITTAELNDLWRRFKLKPEEDTKLGMRVKNILSLSSANYIVNDSITIKCSFISTRS